MALKWSDETDRVQKTGGQSREKEKKELTTFSIEPSFKEELQNLFDDMGLGWAAGIRFALKEMLRKHSK